MPLDTFTTFKDNCNLALHPKMGILMVFPRACLSWHAVYQVDKPKGTEEADAEIRVCHSMPVTESEDICIKTKHMYSIIGLKS